MSTNSRIVVHQADGCFRSIYCHFDGYPDGVGEILKTNYQDLNKINALLDKGDRSDLGVTPDQGCSYADRGEDVPARLDKTISDIEQPTCNEGFIYLFEPEDGRWYYTKTNNLNWKLL